MVETKAKDSLLYEESEWSPESPEWNIKESLCSPGGQAKLLWEQCFKECAEIPLGKSQIIFTGIGGAVANADGLGGVKRHGDHSEIPKYIDLEKTFKEVPELLFLVASSVTADNVLGLKSLARQYKNQGVRKIITVLTGLAHERQDKDFFDQGEKILETDMLNDVLGVLAQEDIIVRSDEKSWERCIDGGLIIQPHSLESVKFALQRGFPLLPIDAFDFLVANSGITGYLQDTRDKVIIIGPDKGRGSVAKRFAALFKLPFASAKKVRARREGGYPTVTLPTKVLDYIRDNNCTVITFDDEVREGATIGELAKLLQVVAKAFKVYVIKPIFASNSEGTKTAIDHLLHSLIDEIVITDAVQPLNDVIPISHKLKVVSLWQDIMNLLGYLQRNLVRPNDPNWLRDPAQTQTLLKLDLQ